MPDDELEQFVREWALQKKVYFGVEKLSGAYDMGRDVVGYLTKDKHEGGWHNYQCKQYGRSLPTDKAFLEIGKILYFSHRGEFTAPTAYFFVAPGGVNRNLKRFLSKPNEFRATLIARWDEVCANAIASDKVIALDDDLKAFIAAWDFSAVSAIGVDEIIQDASSKPFLHTWFGVDPGPPPAGVVPEDVQGSEMPYVEQLLDAYSERHQQVISTFAIAKANDNCRDHLQRQRQRFFEADAFSRFYRDNTMSAQIDDLRHQVLHGVAEVHEATHKDSLARVDAVMMQAGVVNPSGILAQYAKVPVKQGLCHHFANEGAMLWKKK